MLRPMKWLFRLVVVLGVVFVAIQFVPYGRDHTNPLSVKEPKWNSPMTRSLAVDGCFSCHSNLTEWAWYTDIAPFSWLVTRDVNDGRAVLNFSEWQKPQDVDIKEVVDAIRNKDMPPIQYRLVHKEARLTDTQRQVLEQGLLKTWAADPPGKKGGS
jgi:hypothetical protein